MAMRRARFRPCLHLPAGVSPLGPHVHAPRRRPVLRARGVRAFVGDAVASAREMLDSECAQAVVLGNGFLETYCRRLDPRLQGLYHALARPQSESPLLAMPGWRRRFPAVARGLDALEAKTRRVARYMCRTYAAFRARRRAAAARQPRLLRRWFGHGAADARRSRLRRGARNRAAKRRACARARRRNSRT